jgi:flagellar protein FliO/FliZ
MIYNCREISYTGREKLKLSACSFRLLVVFFALSAFILPVTGVFAQEEPATDPTAQGSPPDAAVAISETLEVDPITAAERELYWGADAATEQRASATSALNIFKVLITLILAAAAIYGLVYLLKRFSRGGMARDPFLKVLASAPLGTNRSAHIISVGSQAWLVGSAESGVNLISEIQDKDTLNALLLEDSRKIAESAEGGAGRFPDFKSMLRRLGMPVDSNSPPSPEDIRKHGERLKGM